VTKSLKHKFLSSIADGTDATLVRPSNWNDDHDFWWGYRTVASTTDTIANADHMTLIVYSAAGATTVSLAAPTGGNMPTGWRTRIRRTGAAALTLSGTGGATFNGAASVTLNQGDSYDIHSTGAVDYVGVAHAAPSAAAPAAVIVGGILKYVSATALSFLPFKGNQTVINGSAYTIPATGNGIAGLANTGVYVNGVAAQNLAANTTYYVYEFNNAGTVTADFSTTNHATSIAAGNSGTEIKSGDETRSLIGQIRTNASSQFVDGVSQRFVRSWFNDGGVSVFANFSATRSTSNVYPTWAELHAEIRNEVLLWAGEKLFVVCSGTYQNNVASTNYTALGIDSATTAETASQASCALTAGGYYSPFALNTNKSGLSEGYHYATLLGSVASGTGLWIGASDTTYKACCALQCFTMKG